MTKKMSEKFFFFLCHLTLKNSKRKHATSQQLNSQSDLHKEEFIYM